MFVTLDPQPRPRYTNIGCVVVILFTTRSIHFRQSPEKISGKFNLVSEFRYRYGNNFKINISVLFMEAYASLVL